MDKDLQTRYDEADFEDDDFEVWEDICCDCCYTDDDYMRLCLDRKERREEKQKSPNINVVSA